MVSLYRIQNQRTQVGEVYAKMCSETRSIVDDVSFHDQTSPNKVSLAAYPDLYDNRSVSTPRRYKYNPKTPCGILDVYPPAT
jgi:hypothetical protein